MTTVERFDDDTGDWVSLDNYGSFEIEFGVSDVLVAPEATITLPRTADVSAGVRIRIREDGATIFEGNAVRTKPRRNGPMRVDLEHDAFGLFEETVDLSVSGTDEDVLQAALSAASGTWTLAYPGTATTLGDDYEADGRTVKRVFRDITDRVGRVWWVDVDHTITVAPLGDGGLLASVDTSTDAARVDEWTPDDTDTVVNDVTVIGTGGEKVEGSASDAASINEFGREPERVNVEYVRSTGEANDYASELLNPEPDAAATVTVGASVADVAGPVVNQTLDVTDEQGTGMDAELPIESQTVTQGRAEFSLGEGAGVNTAKFNRREKSKADTTRPGSVFGSDRLASGSVDTDQLVDTAVITQKIADLSIDETKVQDDSISTPKLQAEAVTAAEILAGTITANELAAGSITANEIDTLELETGQLSVGTDTDGRILFEIDSSGPADLPIMVPDDDDNALIGDTGRRFLEIWGDFGYFTNLQFGDFQVLANDIGGTYNIRPASTGDGDLGQDSQRWGEAWVDETRSNAMLPRDGSGTGNVGLTGDFWQAMRAEAYFEESPAELDDGDIDLAELCRCGWYDPPAYVARESARKEAQAEGDGDVPTDGLGEPAGLELGTVSNYLLGVCQAQQDVIDDLEARVAALEEAVDPNA